MSNSSSPITPIYGSDEYNIILAAIPLEVVEEESSSDFFSPVRPRRNVALAVIRPVPRPITPRLFPVDLSPCGQRFNFEEWSPPAIIMNPPFRYAEMTPSNDSGYSTHRESQIVDWHHVSPVEHVFHASPVINSPSTPTLPPRRLSPRQLFPPTTASQSPLRRAVPHGSLNPADISPDMFTPTTPRPASLMVRNDLYAVSESQSTISPSILQLVQHRPTSEHNVLIEGEILNTAECSGHEQSDAMEWGDDGNEEELNVHMDIYEGWGSDYGETNELILKNIK